MHVRAVRRHKVLGSIPASGVVCPWSEVDSIPVHDLREGDLVAIEASVVVPGRAVLVPIRRVVSQGRD